MFTVCGKDILFFSFSGSKLFDTAIDKDKIIVSWENAGNGLAFKSHWSFSKETGVISRRDILINEGQKKVNLLRYLACFIFVPGRYEAYSQCSSWCKENQGSWQDLSHGSFILSCEAGRTTQGSTPYLCIRNKYGRTGAVFHIVPNGNWIIKIHASTSAGDSLRFPLHWQWASCGQCI